MKTTIDIPDALLAELKRRAARDRTTLRAIIQSALRQYLVQQRKARREFRLRDASVPGRGVRPGVREGDWNTLRELIYEGRGG
jgi:hypothetical protein